MTGLRFLPLVFTLLFTVSCSKEYLKKILADNPEILTEAIEKNPKAVIEALNKASIKFRQEQIALAEKKRQAELEEAFANPKKPDTPKDRIYFGDVNAPLTIVEYSDFQCPYCKMAGIDLEVILKEYKGLVRILYKHFPLDQIHPQARLASQYYEALGKVDPSKAKAFHDQLYAQQRKIAGGENFLDQVVKDLGVDVKKVKKELDKVKSIIEADLAEARKFGFSGTPGFLMAGVPIKGKPELSKIRETLDRRLKDEGIKKEVKKDVEGETS